MGEPMSENEPTSEEHFEDQREDEGLRGRLEGLVPEIFKRTLPDVGVSHDPVQQMRLKIEELKANTLLGGSYGKSVDCIDMLNEISKRIPPAVDVKLTRVVIGIDSVVISGDTDTFNAVDEIKMRLQEIEFFEKVDINSANMDKSGDKNNTGQRVRFKLRVEL